jgi:hypothetical protein
LKFSLAVILYSKTITVFMKKLIALSIIAFSFAACGGKTGEGKETATGHEKKESEETTTGNPSYDPNRGEGKFTSVEVSPSLNETKATAGNQVYSVKCSGCHKLTDEKLVGPGWKGVTSRHSAEWIMNFATNTDAMLDKDPKARALLEICLVRMPNQNLADEDARNVYEFMRKNDGVK